MATERQLRQQMRELRNEIERIRRESAARENELRQSMTEQMRQFENRLSREMERHQRETEEEYTARIRRLQEEYSKETEKAMRVIKKNAEDALRLQKEKFAQLQKCNKELLDLLEKTRDQNERANERQRQRALELQQEMNRSREKTKRTPHSFFFDGEFEIIDARANGLAAEIQNEMYQSAAADASAAALQFELLAVKVAQALEEWVEAFNDFRALIYTIDSRITQLEQYTIQTAAGCFNMKPQELEFWSSETFLEFRKKIKKALEEVKLIEEKGIVDYLLECPDENRRTMFGKVSDARKWNDEFTGIANCILSERIMSDERWMLGAAVKQALYNIGYNVKVRRFRRTSGGSVVFQNDSNPLDCYDMVFSIQGLDDIVITFCPVRQNGVTVRNECLVSSKPFTICSPDFVNRVIMSIVDTIKGIDIIQEKSVSVLGIPFSNNSERIKQTEEANQKKQPDPKKQLMHIQRKYY